MKIGWAILCIVCMQGCGSSTGSSVNRGLTNEARPISTTAFTALVRDFEAGYFAAVSFPEVNALPSVGSGSYSGKLAFDFAGDARGTATADLDMQIDFASGRVSGDAQNFAFARDNESPTSASGTLNVSGVAEGGRLSADVEGVLSGPPRGLLRHLDATATLQGGFRGLNGRPERVAGNLNGEFTGSSKLTITYGLGVTVLQAPQRGRNSRHSSPRSMLVRSPEPAPLRRSGPSTSRRPRTPPGSEGRTIRGSASARPRPWPPE
jgi:hypothetical protein